MLKHTRNWRADIDVAETRWIKAIQKSLRKNPKFEIRKRQFGIFTDEHGIMRCMGRLSQAQLPASAKYPILLGYGHYITSLFARDSHKRVMHGGVKSTLTELRSWFWIVLRRQFVRKVLYECLVCQRLEGKPYVAPPTPHPEFRVKEESPFTYVAIDLFGPLYVKSLTVLTKRFGSAFTRAASLEPFIWILYQIEQLMHSWEPLEDLQRDGEDLL